MQQKNDKTVNLALIIGDVVKNLRMTKKNCSINRFAREYELDAGNTSRIEKGLIEVKVVTLWKIAEALDMKLSDLIKEVESRAGDEFHLIDY